MVGFAQQYHFQKCPPMPAHGVLPPEPAFGKRRKKPVSPGTGISFEDLRFIQTEEHRGLANDQRRLPTPSWALNLSQQRELLARFWELRVGIKYPRIDTAARRLRYAYRKYKLERLPRLNRVLDALCHEFVASTDPERRRLLQIEIQNYDTQIRIAKQGPALIVGIIHGFYGACLDSPGTASELGIKPQAARQILFRLHALWKKMQDGADHKPKPEEVRAAKNREHSRRYKARNRQKVLEQNHRYYDRVRRAAKKAMIE